MTPDQIQFQSSGSPLNTLLPIDTLPGVQILAVAALCGPGQGLLSIDAAGNLSWTPPGGAAGGAINVSAGGNFTLYDSAGNAWLSVFVGGAYLALAAQATVTLEDLFGGQLIDDDVTAAEASAGDVETWSIELANTSTSGIGSVVTWLDPETYAGLEISLDGTTWSRPTTQSAGLAVGTIAAAGSATIYLRRTVPAGAPSLADALVLLYASWSTPSAGQTAARGMFHIYGPAEYRIYRSQGSPPVQGSTPWATASTLPATPTDTFADGTWYLAVSYFDGIYDSGFYPVGPAGETYQTLVISGGTVAAAPPPAPLAIALQESNPGVVSILAMVASATAEATEWQISYTVNGGAATIVTKPFTAAALAVLSYSLPAQSAGSLVAVSVQLSDSGTLSPAISASITLAAGSGPSAPLGAVASEPVNLD